MATKNDFYMLSTSTSTSDIPILQTIKDNKIDKEIKLPDDFKLGLLIYVFIDNAIAWHNNTLYIGGYSGSGGSGKMYVASLDGNSFKEISIGDQDGSILTMTTHNNTLYIGCFIDSSSSKSYVAYLDDNSKSFKEIDTKEGYIPISLYSYKEEKKDDNLALILGLTLGLGIPLVILILYYTMRK